MSVAIQRSDAEALMPEAVSREIIKNVEQQSAVLSLGRRLPNMSRQTLRMPVLSALAQAYFVTGDTGLKQLSKTAWQNRYITAEEIAVIVPIPENVIDDTDYDIWGEVRPAIEEAIGEAIDRAILFGENSPSSWPDDIVSGATAAGHSVDQSTAESGGSDYYDTILGEGGVNSFVEEDGYVVTGHVMPLVMKSRLRGLRDSQGQPLFMRTMQDTTRYELDGAPVEFPVNGSMDATQALDIVGDWRQLVYAIRQDVSFKILDQATLTDNAGNVIFNLPQQDMVALRAKIRLGWQLPNPVNRVNQNEATRYPFAVLVP